jgi:Cdc6-like AAA superfamily ATPase
MLITIVGKRGRGKTSLVIELVKNWDADRVLILDFLGEYSELAYDSRIKISRGNLYPFLKEAWDESPSYNRTLIVLDEIDCYSKYDEHISYIYKYGRHARIEIIAVSRTFMVLKFRALSYLS